MKKGFSLAGIAVGALMIIFGIVAMCGGFGDADYSGSNSPYNSGYATFGADYYTYSVNNSAETASAARSANSNLGEISNILRNCLGLIMLAIGFICICGFGIVYAGCTEPQKSGINTVEIPETVEEYALSEENDEEIQVIEEEIQTDIKTESDYQ